MLAAVAFGQTDALYQVSTLEALVDGVMDGETTLEALSVRGDFGIGTFNAVDGELLLVNGLFYRIDGTGKVRLADKKEMTPFALVTFFETDQTAVPDSALSMDAFGRWLDARLPSSNLFYAVQIDGRFRSVKTRSVPRQQKPYPRLTDVVKTQPVFEFEHVRGVMVGFRLPEFIKGVNMPGYHLHFLMREGMGGGHVLGFVPDRVTVQIDQTDEFVLKLPGDEAFLKTDLSGEASVRVKQVEKE
jgi:acetolactate decarboxylase